MKLPKGWSVSAINDVVADLEAGVSVIGEDSPADVGEFGVLKVSAVSNGRFLPEQNKRITGAELKRATVKPRKGSILVSRCNTLSLVGDNALVETTHTNLFLPDKIWQLKFHHAAQVDARWLSQVLQTRRVRTQLIRQATGTSGSMKNISKESFLDLELIFPPFHEQRKIAEILGAWDDGLESLDALIAAKERRKKGLMQRLLTGKRRGKGAEEKWQKKRIGEMLRESRLPGGHGLTASKITVKLYGRGVVAKQERLQGSPNTKYFTRRAGQFIYSKLDFLNGAFGIIPKDLDEFESTLDLPAFDVAEECDSRWLLAYVSRPSFYKRQLGSAAGGRKARRVNPLEFLSMEISAPPLPEQRAIADILDACDEELCLLRARRAAIEKQKRGLMQRLLTGRTRTHGLTRTDKD